MLKLEPLTQLPQPPDSTEPNGSVPEGPSPVLRNELLPSGTRREQLVRQRQRLEEALDALGRVTRERDQLWKDLCRTGSLADNALAEAERAQQRALELQAELDRKDQQLRELQEENAALIEQGSSMAERLELAEARWRVLISD